MAMNNPWGLYHKTYINHHQGGGSSWQRLLATDGSKKALRERWNQMQKQQCIEYSDARDDYHQFIDPPFIEGDSIEFAGNSSEWGSVTNVLYIKRVEQWDQ